MAGADEPRADRASDRARADDHVVDRLLTPRRRGVLEGRDDLAQRALEDRAARGLGGHRVAVPHRLVERGVLRERDGAVVRQAREHAPVADRLVPGQLDQLADHPVRAVRRAASGSSGCSPRGSAPARPPRPLAPSPPARLELGEVARLDRLDGRVRCSAARAAGGMCRALGRPRRRRGRPGRRSAARARRALRRRGFAGLRGPASG